MDFLRSRIGEAIGLGFVPRDSYTILDLLSIMALLRSENGCPWDRAQTHRSIRQNVIEEAYEVAEAIDKEDPQALCEELGDLLLQVVFHSRMGQEAGLFDFDAVTDGICKKLIGRHPHIFGDEAVGSAEEMYALWDRVKAQEKGQTSASQTLRAVASSFPALMRAQKLCSRSERAGLCLMRTDELLAALQSSLDCLRRKLEEGEQASPQDLGSLLFAAAALSRSLGTDAEQSLAAACDRYVERFERMENLIDEQKQTLADLSPERQLALWKAAEDGNSLPNKNTEESEK